MCLLAQVHSFKLTDEDIEFGERFAEMKDKERTEIEAELAGN